MKADVALSKYCDLFSLEHYASIAGRADLEDLLAQSPIEATHHLADFVKPALELSKTEVKRAKLLHADERPHSDARVKRETELASTGIFRQECHLLRNPRHPIRRPALGYLNRITLQIPDERQVLGLRQGTAGGELEALGDLAPPALHHQYPLQRPLPEELQGDRKSCRAGAVPQGASLLHHAL